MDTWPLFLRRNWCIFLLCTSLCRALHRNWYMTWRLCTELLLTPDITVGPLSLPNRSTHMSGVSEGRPCGRPPGLRCSTLTVAARPQLNILIETTAALQKSLHGSAL